MKDKEFDYLIKKRVNEHESPVSPGMWGRITRKEKKRRAGLYLRFYPSLLALVLVGASFIYYFSSHHTPKEKEILAGIIERGKNEIKKDTQSNRKANILQPGTVTKKQNNLTGINNRQQENKLLTNKKRFPNRKKKKSIDYDSPQLVKTAGNNNFTSEGVVTDYLNGNSDSGMKKPLKQTTVPQLDSTSNAEMKAEEPVNDKFSLELYTSPDLPLEDISSANKPYEQALKNAGIMQLSYSFGARICYHITKRFSAKIGLQYSQVNERISFTDAQGNHINSANRYKTIGIPLLVSYQAPEIGSLYFSVNTGIVLNIFSQYKGIIPSSTGQSVDIRNGDVYDRNISASLYLGIDISKRINKRMDFFAEPWINSRLKNMVNQSYSFTQKIHSTGLSIGLRYRLFKNNGQQF
jgi:hypothetical protein